MNENMVIILMALHTKDIQDNYARALDTYWCFDKLEQLGLIENYDCIIGLVWRTTSEGVSWLRENTATN
jgi:hypothetical protein